ncbi:MAG: hypothetical protein K8R18_16435 [Parvibaculum sp.]|uniref:hypothetical protein n=1 Tax=Parvibaculum sp. TaxID=2024848 RepID=UPI0025D4D4E4|nr:hypothetical protein [Parvibaculum sp.]MCE9651208.1 hypothetical protein [Parvibaculum sp.]
MSANEKAMRPTQQQDAVEDAPKRATPHAAYYQVLADRLETLLRDMQATGTPPDDALLLRLADLLAETRGRLRKASR